jgi:hypothetical protein
MACRELSVGFPGSPRFDSADPRAVWARAEDKRKQAHPTSTQRRSSNRINEVPLSNSLPTKAKMSILGKVKHSTLGAHSILPAVFNYIFNRFI